MLTCPKCEIGLREGTRRCPKCGRLLALPGRIMLVAGVVLLVLLGLALWRSGVVKSRLAWGETRPADAYKAAIAVVAQNPAVLGAVKYSTLEETLIERLDLGRWRVAGFADMAPQPDVKTHVLYTCVLRYTGSGHWAVEDMQFERVD